MFYHYQFYHYSVPFTSIPTIMYVWILYVHSIGIEVKLVPTYTYNNLIVTFITHYYDLQTLRYGLYVMYDKKN